MKTPRPAGSPVKSRRFYANARLATWTGRSCESRLLIPPCRTRRRSKSTFCRTRKKCCTQRSSSSSIERSARRISESWQLTGENGMAADVVMPQMGESIFEGTITKWLKKAGDKVERDEPLFEISTDKVDAEIPSPSAGVLKEIKVKEGQTVPINTVVATIDAAGAAASAPAPAAAPAPASGKAEAPKPAAAPAPAPQPVASKPGPVPVPSAPQQAAAAAAAPAKEGARIHSSPLVRRMAKEHGIDLSTVPGTGAGGRISKQDIEAAIAGGGAPSSYESAAEPAYPAPAAALQASRPAVVLPPPPPASPSPAGHGTQYIPSLQTGVPRERLYFGDYEVEPLSTMRLKIAEHMVASKHVSPHVYSVDEIDMSKIAALRAKSKDEFEKEYGAKLTFMPFFVKAAVAGL